MRRRRPGLEKALRVENKPRVFADIATKKRFRVRKTKQVSLRLGSPDKFRFQPEDAGKPAFPQGKAGFLSASAVRGGTVSAAGAEEGQRMRLLPSHTRSASGSTGR